MYLLQNSHWQTSTLLRGLLTIVFIFWLASVMIKYNEKTTTQKPEITNKPPPSNIMLEQLTLPPIPKPAPKPAPKSSAKLQSTEVSTEVSIEVSKVSKLAKQTVKAKNEAIKQSPQTPSVNKQQIQKVYQTLSDDGVDIQIAWPQNMNKRQAALNFMYQCVGVQFAVLNGNALTKINQTKLTDHSEWIRVAQGSLSKKEQNWLNAYAIKGTPIRLFPRQLDWRLAQYLANALNGKPLVSLRAKYKVTNQQFQLVNIQLNHQQLTDIWTLYQGNC
jgi:hypothetical protein